ncbi:MAG: lycopene cyclase family protein [Anaerolineales bacterium]
MRTDYAILGGGAAGLSLALALVRSPLKDRSILIVEKDAKDTNDRTWCFWSDVPSPLDGIAHHVWPNLRFRSPGLDRTFALAPFRYQMVRGVDFYRAAREELGQHHVTFLRGSGEVQDGSETARVQVNGENWEATWAFDSRMRPADLHPDPRHYTYLIQHFTGWEVETRSAAFDPQTVTLFDLRTPQVGGVTFFYILPFSERRALVEYTLFSPQVLPAAAYEVALQAYLVDTLGAADYRLLSEERGVIPMTDHPFPRRLGKRLMAIGTRGGRVKPSTGYAFARIQRDSQAIVDSLIRTAQPFAIRPDAFRYRFHDAVLLEVISREPERGRTILAAIFGRNPIRPILRFLDDRSSLLDDLRVIASNRPWPFLRSAGRWLWKKTKQALH